MIESTYGIQLNSKLHLYTEIHTAATSGVINTQSYGQQFKSELVERKMTYRVFVLPPVSVKDNENVTLHLSLEKVSMTGLTGDSKDKVKMGLSYYLDADQTTASTNFTPPGSGMFFDTRNVELFRDVSHEEVESQQLDVMPGFRFRWWYTGAEVTPDNRYKGDKMTKIFVRYVYCTFVK